MYAGGSLSALTTLDFGTSASASGALLPTPTARDWKDTAGMALERPDGKPRTDRLPMYLFSLVRSAGIPWKTMTATGAPTVTAKGLPVLIAGPDYCPELPEWLMGWPIGWTALSPLATARFRAWQLQHSDFSPSSSDASPLA
jgi:hypothetical protein